MTAYQHADLDWLMQKTNRTPDQESKMQTLFAQHCREEVADEEHRARNRGLSEFHGPERVIDAAW